MVDRTHTYLLDTVLLIDHLNGVEKATKWLSRLQPDESVISVITRAETLTGTDESNSSQIKMLLDEYPCLSITPAIADAAAALRRKFKWKLPDALQAALALHHHLSLATRNTKDFDPRLHPFVVIPYTIS